jgi:tetratricopeptide (TPR) repeat protein
LRLDPNSVLANWYMANYVLNQEKAPDKALEYVAKCSEKECFDLRAKLLKQLGRVDESVGILKRMVASVSLNHEEQFNIGMTYIQLKKWADAESIFLDILSKYPQDDKSAFNLAWVEIQLENWPVAQERWLAAAKLSPNVEGVWSNLKFVAQHTGDTAVSNTCDQELARIKNTPKQ